MRRTQRNIGRLVFRHQEHLFATRHLGRALHHDPVFRAMMMLLQRQRGAGVDDDALDLETLAVIHRIVRAPRPIDLAMRFRQRMATRFDLGHQLLHVLRAVQRRDHDHVRRFDHHHVANADARDHAPLGKHQAALRIVQHHLATGGVAIRILVKNLPQRIPCTDVRPAGRQRHHLRGDSQTRIARKLFHHRIVDRV